MIKRVKKICKKCQQPRYIFSKGMCQGCQPKKKVKNGNKNARANSDFYQSVILENKGKPCQECGAPIPYPSASNVSHIITRGANTALRYDHRNYNWYCSDCHNRYEFGDRLGMETNRRNQDIKIELLNEYYNSKPWKGVGREVDAGGSRLLQDSTQTAQRSRSDSDCEEEGEAQIESAE